MIGLYKLLPKLLREDDFSRCLSEVIDQYIKEIDDVYNGLFLMHNLDQFDDRVLDEIAKDRSIVWYDSALPIKHKANIIKNYRSTYKNLGTESAILQLIHDYWGSAGSIDNWYDYGGSHHRFKITINDVAFDKAFLEAYGRFLSSLSWVKSADTWLDGVCIKHNINTNTYFGIGINRIKNLKVNISPHVEDLIESSFFVGVGVKRCKKIKVQINPINYKAILGRFVCGAMKVGEINDNT